MTSIPIRSIDRIAGHLHRHRLGYWDAAVLAGTVLFLIVGGLISMYLLHLPTVK